MKVCTICLEQKASTEFFKQKNRYDANYRRSACKVCTTKVHTEYVAKNKDRINAQRKSAYHSDKRQAIAWNLKRYYGMTLEQYNNLMISQEYRCKICGDHQKDQERRFDVDHCHKTKKIRGLLCIRCNRGIGLLKDSIEILEAAIRHIKEGQELEDKKPLG